MAMRMTIVFAWAGDAIFALLLRTGGNGVCVGWDKDFENYLLGSLILAWPPLHPCSCVGGPSCWSPAGYWCYAAHVPILFIKFRNTLHCEPFTPSWSRKQTSFCSYKTLRALQWIFLQKKLRQKSCSMQCLIAKQSSVFSRPFIPPVKRLYHVGNSLAITLVVAYIPNEYIGALLYDVTVLYFLQLCNLKQRAMWALMQLQPGAS